MGEWLIKEPMMLVIPLAFFRARRTGEAVVIIENRYQEELKHRGECKEF
jgi:hypothetical protein